MKARVVILISFAIFLGFLVYKFLGISSVPTASSPLPVPTTAARHTDATLTYQGVVYDYEFFTTDRPDKLQLLPNFTSPTRGANLATDNNCEEAINGGFYATDNTPLGVFIGSGYTQDKALKSPLFNGFFSFGSTNAAITKTFDSSYTSVLQTGPLLFYDMSPLPLAIQNDEHARRSVVALTDEGSIVFLTVYIHDSIYNGPLLGDLPLLLKQFAQAERISIKAALNLDGGSATYFKTRDMELPELTPVGSLICLTK